MFRQSYLSLVQSSSDQLAGTQYGHFFHFPFAVLTPSQWYIVSLLPLTPSLLDAVVNETIVRLPRMCECID